jgi:hypothetical protein
LDQGREPAQGLCILVRQAAICTQCGSHIVAQAGSGFVLLRMGSLDLPITQRPQMHIW